MRIIQLVFIYVFLVSQGFSQTIKIKEPVRFLALGDSYTIGQSVPVNDRWPSQFAAELGKQGYNVEELKIIAQTGWTTASLQNAINQQMPLNDFTLVSLLIGVNNQFQGGSIDTYTVQFRDLLQHAIYLAGREVRGENGSGLSQTVINLSGMPGGIYVIKLITEERRILTAKIALI